MKGIGLNTAEETIVVLDFGSQYTQLICRRIREQNVYAEILRHDTPAAVLAGRNVKGIILTGGPASVYAAGAPRLDPAILDLGAPVLGICYGLQVMTRELGAAVKSAAAREYGFAELTIVRRDEIMDGLPDKFQIWNSHGDQIEEIPADFMTIGRTPTCPFAAVRHVAKPLFGVQFHPEVYHTPLGGQILANFVRKVCGTSGAWKMASFIEREIAAVRERVGSEKIICGLSGGVDSSVVAALLSRAVGKQLSCVFVNNGLLRKNEAPRVIDTFGRHFKTDLHYVDAGDRFLSALKGVTDPEKKRKIIGHLFIDVFTEETKKIENVKYLAQGTLYPDVVESVSYKGGPSAVIKSHHNVGGLPEKLGFELIEPVRDLFKDEVREIGRELGLPEEIVGRQPFPGPGLGVRVVGEVTPERVRLLQEADWIVIDEIKKAGYYRKCWQSFAVLLPVKSVGVMGDERTYQNAVAIRAVESTDGMTADWAHLPYELLGKISNRIINEVDGINRVVYDITSKPPGTIEWE